MKNNIIELYIICAIHNSIYVGVYSSDKYDIPEQVYGLTIQFLDDLT